MRIIFAGTPTFAAIQLAALCELQHEIVAVYTQPDRPSGRGQALQASPVKQLASDKGLKVEQPLNFKTQDTIKILQSYQADVMIVAAYGLLLPQAVLDTPRHGCINVHASLLPRWRGASPIQHAILAGDSETGITLMQMEAGLDTGPMLCKQSIKIESQDTAQTLHDKLAQLGANCLKGSLEDCVFRPVPEKQRDEFATLAPKISKQDALIDWQDDATHICRKIHAYNPWPGAYTYLADQRIKCFTASPQLLNVKAAPGTIVELDDNGIIVATGTGAVCLHSLQMPGKKPCNASLFAHSSHPLWQTNQRLHRAPRK